MNSKTLDNLFAFFTGDVLATISLFALPDSWIHAIEQAGIKLLVIIVSGLIGGAAGLLGKELMQRFINKYFSIIIIFLVFMQAGCSPKVAGVTTHAATTTTDSTSTLVTERLVPVYLPGDTLVYFAEVECPDGTSPAPIAASVNSKRSSLAVDLKGSQLAVTANCKEWQDSIKVRDAEINRLKTSVRSTDTKETIPVKYIPKIYVYAMWYACIDLGQKVLRLLLSAALSYFKIQLPFKIPFL